jgi:hypothetical protein
MRRFTPYFASFAAGLMLVLLLFVLTTVKAAEGEPWMVNIILYDTHGKIGHAQALVPNGGDYHFCIANFHDLPEVICYVESGERAVSNAITILSPVHTKILLERSL